MTFEEWIILIRDKASARGIDLKKIPLGYIDIMANEEATVSISGGEVVIDN